MPPLVAAAGCPCAEGWKCRDGRTEKGGSSGKKNMEGNGVPRKESKGGEKKGIRVILYLH